MSRISEARQRGGERLGVRKRKSKTVARSMPLNKLEARGNASVVEALVEKIKDRIRDGRFAPGQRLVESDISNLFDVSRGPVREAIRRLNSEGLIEVRHNSGATVRALSRMDVCNVFQIREVLEGMAGRLAAENVKNGADLSKLQALEARFDREFDGSSLAYMRYNDAFHDLIVRLSGNDQLIQIVRQLQVRVYRIQYDSLRSSDAFLRSRSEHKAILQALVRGDAARAERLLHQHVRRRLPQILADRGDFFA
jgi:DNA-binding GntR family transcriptional regulator